MWIFGFVDLWRGRTGIFGFVDLWMGSAVDWDLWIRGFVDGERGGLGFMDLWICGWGARWTGIYGFVDLWMGKPRTAFCPPRTRRGEKKSSDGAGFVGAGWRFLAEVAVERSEWRGAVAGGCLCGRDGRRQDRAGPHGSPGLRARAPEVLMPGYPVPVLAGLT